MGYFCIKNQNWSGASIREGRGGLLWALSTPGLLLFRRRQNGRDDDIKRRTY